MKIKINKIKLLFFISILVIMISSNAILIPANYTEAATVKLSKTPKVLLIGSWKMADGTIMKFDAKGIWSMTAAKSATQSIIYEAVTIHNKPNCLNIYALDKNNKRGQYIIAQFTSDNNMMLGSDKLTRVTTTAVVPKFKLSSPALPIALVGGGGKWKSANGINFKFNSNLTATVTGDKELSEDGTGRGTMAFNFTYSIPDKTVNTIVLNMSNVNYEYILTIVFTDDNHVLISERERHSSTYTYKNVKFTKFH